MCLVVARIVLYLQGGTLVLLFPSALEVERSHKVGRPIEVRIILSVASTTIFAKEPVVSVHQVVKGLVRQYLSATHCYIYRCCAINKAINAQCASYRFISIIGKGYGVGIKRQIIDGKGTVGTSGYRLCFANAYLNASQRSVAMLAIKHGALYLGRSIYHRCVNQCHTIAKALRCDGNADGLVVLFRKSKNGLVFGHLI